MFEKRVSCSHVILQGRGGRDCITSTGPGWARCRPRLISE
ncbi:hypothetical protein ANMWB30_04610 [Arthrobacter sp. MWB30]|nr:hypothetical protein ANMWB30_04610 [Arthrobacter sp. MWB30]